MLGEDAKFAAFRAARAALAASGTATLELALAGVPMVGAYKVSLIEEQLKYLIKVPSILLPNLILGERAIPEFLQRECTPAGPRRGACGPRARKVQRAARRSRRCRGSIGSWRLADGGAPSVHAARAVLDMIEGRKIDPPIPNFVGCRIWGRAGGG